MDNYRMAICRRPIRFSLAVLAMICTALTCLSQAASPASEAPNIGPVVRDMCGKSVGFIGESPVHGFGKTLEFKIELVRRLVDECHYGAVFFESGIYDFLNIQQQVRSGHGVTDSMIAAAIGGLWANKEVQPLIPFLRERATKGTVYLGGLDDQLGRGTWAQEEMPSTLAAYLPENQKARCLAILQKHMLWQYTDDAPYGPDDKARIVGCLDSISGQLSKVTQGTDGTGAVAALSPAPQSAGEDTRDTANVLAMIASLKRQFDRDFQKVPAGIDEDTLGWNQRDRSMYLNFRWLLSQLPPRSKVIVWTATVHAAKELSTVPEEASRTPLGLYIHRDFKNRAFALGFSAYSGSYARAGQPVRPLDPAPQGSLESRSFAGGDGDTVYLSRSELQKIGPVAARPLGTNFTTARWGQVLDGLVIFRREQPPEYLRH